MSGRHSVAHFSNNIGQQSRTGLLHLRWRSRNDFRADGGKEAITATGNGLKVQRIVGVVAECGANLLDALIYTLFKIDERVVSPQLFLNLIPSDHLAGAG